MVLDGLWAGALGIGRMRYGVRGWGCASVWIRSGLVTRLGQRLGKMARELPPDWFLLLPVPVYCSKAAIRCNAHVCF